MDISASSHLRLVRETRLVLGRKKTDGMKILCSKDVQVGRDIFTTH